MATALQTGVLGMSAYQNMLNVTGNNIANADTTAFKQKRTTFAQMFSSTLSPGKRPTENTGGVNPLQVGLGTRISSVDQDMSQGGFTATENDFDIAMEGKGFFTVHDGNGELYTRDGTFDVDADNFLVDPSTGYRVQRIGTTGEGAGFQAAGVGDVKIPYDSVLPGSATRTVDFVGNLSADGDTAAKSELEAMSRVYTLASGGYAAEADDFADIQQLQGFAAGDTITIEGRANDGRAVSDSFTFGAVNDGTTLQDLMDKVVNAFGGAGEVEASVQEGKLRLSAVDEGYSLLDVNLSSTAHPDALPSDFNYVSAGGADSHTCNISVFDSQGRSHALTGTFVRQSAASNTWDFVINEVEGAAEVRDRRIAGLSFDGTGTFQGVTETDGYGNKAAASGFGEWDKGLEVRFPGIGGTQEVQANFGQAGTHDGITQYGGDSSAGPVDQDGYAAGALQSVSIDEKGVIEGTFSNGVTRDIAALKLASFSNPQGLERSGANYYRRSPAAGAAVYSQGLQGGVGKVRQSVLEDSNVDVAQQFTRLITAQRGFQINSRTVRVANQMLQQMASIIV